MALHPEQIDHINTINWFNHAFPELEKDFHHFANERKCTVMQGRTLKRMGVKKGVLDFHLAFSHNGYFGLWIELKVGKGKLSPEQIDFIDRKNLRGYYASVVYGFEDAKKKIVDYLNGYKTDSNDNQPNISI